jgi:hypothetical protein
MHMLGVKHFSLGFRTLEKLYRVAHQHHRPTIVQKDIQALQEDIPATQTRGRVDMLLAKALTVLLMAVTIKFWLSIAAFWGVVQWVINFSFSDGWRAFKTVVIWVWDIGVSIFDFLIMMLMLLYIKVVPLVGSMFASF